MEGFPPSSIMINRYQYTKKDRLSNNIFSYRCKYRSQCPRVSLKISEENLKRIKDNNNNLISFELKGVHNCEEKLGIRLETAVKS